MRLTFSDDARAVAWLRIGLGFCTITYGIESQTQLRQIAESGLRMPVLEFLPTASPTAAQIYLCVAALAGVLIALGLFAAQAAVAAALANAFLLIMDQQTYTHHGWLITILLLLLVWTRPDRKYAVRATPAARDEQFPWAGILMLTQLSICYLFAGISKVSGAFLSGEPLDRWMRWDLPPVLDQGMAFSTVGVEVFLAFGLWFARTRVVAAITGIMLHLSILVLIQLSLTLLTFAGMCLALYPLYFCVSLQRVPGTDRYPSRGRRARWLRGNHGRQADSTSGPGTGVTSRNGGTSPESASTSRARRSSSSKASSGGGPSSTVTTQS